MSHIPEAAMKHAQPHDDTPTDAQLVREDPTLGDKAADAAERARESVTEAAGRAKDAARANPKTAIGIGAAVVFGMAAAVAAPAVIAKVREKDAPKKKPAAKKAPAKAK